MRNMMASVLTLLLVLSFTLNAQEKPSKEADHAGHKMDMTKDQAKAEKKDGSESAVAVNTICPVSGEDLEDNDHTFVYEGKTYALCCNKCLAKIKKDPEKYISRLSEDGKSLKKK